MDSFLKGYRPSPIVFLPAVILLFYATYLYGHYRGYSEAADDAIAISHRLVMGAINVR